MKVLWKSVVFCFLFVCIPFTNVSQAAEKNEELVEFAKKYIGVPYLFGGSTPLGFDCSGFLYFVYKQFDIELPRTSADQYKVGIPVKKEELIPGDLVFFENTYKSGISHSGIYIGDNKFISATSSKGIAIASLDNSYWGPKFVTGKRIPELQTFIDVSSDHPAFKAIISLAKEEIILGFNNNEFRPDSPVTRGQAAAIINRIFKFSTTTTTSFKDVSPSSTFAKDIAAIKHAGIINGFPDGTFRPNEQMTRAQMAAIVSRAFKIKLNEDAITVSSSYKDVASSYWAYKDIMLLKLIDQTTVYQTELFRATDRATRADYAAAIYNAKNFKK
jgi:peptidoglycan DL-endopeptidase CwlO